MKNIKLIPLKGIEVQNSLYINFGDSKESVIKTLGNPSSGTDKLYYDDLEFCIHLDKNEKVEFIELIYGPFCKNIEPSIYGVNPFAIEAEELVSLLTEKNNGAIDEDEAPYGYCFFNISVGLYRDATVEDIENSIREAKEEGTYKEDKQWLDEDMEKARHFWTIGIGTQNYYS